MKTKLLLLLSCIVPFLVFSQSPSRIALGTTSGTAIQGFQTKYTARTLPAALVSRAATVAPRPGVAADINSIDRTVCEGQAVTLVAQTTTVNNPVFRWYAEPALTTLLSTGQYYTHLPSNVTKSYYITVTGTDTATGDAVTENVPGTAKVVTMTQNGGAVPGVGDFTVSDVTICPGATAMISPVTSVPNASYFWYSDAALMDRITTGTTFEASPAATTTYYVMIVQGSGNCHVVPEAAQPVTVSVKAPALPTDITVSDRTICTGSTARFTATSTLTGPTFTWYSDAELTTVVSTQPTYTTPVLTATTAYYVTVQNAATCESAAVTVQAIVAERPLASDIDTQNHVQVCDVPFPATVTLTATVGPEFTNVYWYSNAGLTNLVNTGSTFTVPVTVGGSTRTYWVATTRTGSSNCQNIPAEAQKVNVYTLSAYQPGSITITGNRPLCLGETQELIATATTDSGTETGIKWYSDESLDPAFLVHDGANFTPVLTETTTFYVQLIGFAYCPNIPGNGKVVTVVVNPVPAPPTGDAAQSFCTGATIADLVINETGPVVWYDVPTGGTALATSTALIAGNYYAAFPAATGICESDRLAVAVTIKTTPPITVINGTVSPTSVCTGSTVTFSATAPTVTAPVFRWYDDNPASGGILVHTGADFTTVLNSTSYEAIYFYVTVQGTNTCESPGKPFNALVKPYATAFSASAANVLLCGSNTTTLLASSSVPSPVYKWYRDPDLTDFLGSGSVFPVTVTDPVTIFYLTVEGSFICQNLPGNAREVKVYMQTVKGSDLIANDATICAGSPVTLSASRNNGIAVGAFTWYSDQALGAANVLATGSTFTPNPAPTVTTTYYVTYKDTQWCENVPGDAKAVTVTVTAVAAPTGDAAQSFCIGATIADLVTNEPGVVWFITPTGGAALAATVTLSYGRTYYGELQSGGCVSPTRLPVTVTLNTTSATPADIESADILFCPAVPVILNAALPAGSTITNPIFTWYQEEGLTTVLGTGPTYTPSPAPTVTTTYYVTVKGDNICENIAGEGKAVQAINTTSGTPTIADAAICSGETVTLTASSPVLDPVYIWYTDGALTDPVGFTADFTPNPPLTQDTTYYVTVEGSGPCEGTVGPAKEVKVTINPQAPVTNLTAIADKPFVCVGDAITFTGSAPGVTDPVFRWYADNDPASPALHVGADFTINVNDISDSNNYFITVAGTGLCESARRGFVFTKREHNIPQRITAPDQLACPGELVTLTASGGLLAPIYRWYTDQTLTTLIPSDPSDPTGASLVPFVPPLGASTYYVTLETNSYCENLPGDAKKVTVYSKRYTEADIVAAPVVVCEGQPVEMKASIASGAGGRIINWYADAAMTQLLATITNGTAFTPNPLPAVGTTTTYYVTGQDNYGCANETDPKAVTLTINPTPAAPVAGPVQEFCQTGRPLVYHLLPHGPEFNWYSSATGGAPLQDAASLTDGNTYYVAAVLGTCESLRTPVTVAWLTPATEDMIDVATAGNGYICSGETETITVSTTAVTNPVFRWYAENTLTTLLHTGAVYTTDSAMNATTQFYVTVSGDGICENQSFNGKVVTIRLSPNSVPADIEVAGTTAFCAGEPTNTTLTASQVTGYANPVFKWYSDPELTTLITTGTTLAVAPTVTTTYYVTLKSDYRCENLPNEAHEVTVLVNPLATATDIAVTGTTAICAGASTTVTADLSTGVTIANPVYTWYSDQDLIAVIATTPDYTTPAVTADATYYVTVKGDGVCENAPLDAHVVTITIQSGATAGDIAASDVSFCVGSPVTLTGGLPAGSTITNPVFTWYREAALTTVLGTGTSFVPSPAPVASTTYYVTVQGDGVCENLPGTGKPVLATLNTTSATAADIEADDVAFCTATVTLTAALPPGSTIINPVFTWYKEYALTTVLGSGPTFTPNPVPATTTTYYVTVKGDNICENITREGKAVKAITANSGTPTVADAAICSGEAVTLTASMATPILNPEYIWYKDVALTEVVAVGPDFTPNPPLTADATYYVTVSGDGPCEDIIGPAKKVDVTIKPVPGRDVITASPDNDRVCIGDTVVFSASAPSILNPVFRWYDADPEFGGNFLHEGAMFSLITTVDAIATQYWHVTVEGSATCESESKGLGIRVNRYATATDVYASIPEFCKGSPVTLSASGGSFDQIYRWYTDQTLTEQIPSDPSDADGSKLTVTPTAATATYYLTIQSRFWCENIPGTAKEVTVQWNEFAEADDINVTDPTICTGTSVTLLATPGLSYSSPAIYHWYTDQTLMTEITADPPTGTPGPFDPIGDKLTVSPTATTSYYVTIQASNVCENLPNTAHKVTVTVAANPGAPTAPATQEFCSAATTTIADLEVTGTDIKWYDAATGGTLLAPTAILIDGEEYYASQTVGTCESILRTVVRVSLLPSATAADIDVDDETIEVCLGETATMTASLSAGSTIVNPVFAWYNNSGLGGALSNNASYTTPPLMATVTYAFYATVKGDGICENIPGDSKRITVTVKARATAANIAVTGTTAICAGATTTVTAGLSTGATIVNPVYTWYSDENLIDVVATTPDYTTPALTATTTYYVTVKGDGVCENDPGDAQEVIITVNSPAAPGVITAADLTVCLGRPITFTASAPTITNPVFTWYGEDTLTTVLATGATFTPNPAPTATTSYFVTVQGDGVCESTPATAKEVTVTISGPAAPAIPPTQNVCVQLPGRISDLFPQGPAFKWYAAETGGSPLSFATPLVDGTTYYVSETQGGCESTRTAVLVTVTSVVPWGDWIVPLEWFCFGESVTFEASSPGDLIINPIYRWYSDEELTNLVHTGPTYTVTPTVDGTFYAFSTAEGDGQCENKLFSHRATAFVKTIPTVADIIADDQGGCVNSTITLSASSPTVSSAIFNWYNDPALTTLVGTGATLDITQAIAGTYLYYVTVQSGRYCESTPANARMVTVTITADPGAPTADATQDFCTASTPTVADLTATGTTIQWYDAATAGNLLAPTTALISGNTYYASQTIGTCESSLRTAVVVTIAADPSAPVADATQDFCTASTPTVADLTATGTTIQWYDAATAGNLLAPTTALISGNTYYASQTIGTCESSLRTAVVVTIAADPSAPVADATQDFCTASTPTVADLTATGTTIQWYDAATAGNLLAPTTALISGSTYYASQTIGTCESSLRTAVVVTIAADPSAPVADATQDFCTASTPTVADLTATGTTIQWYDAATAGNLLAPTTALISGNTYYASQTIGTCESSLRTAVLVTIAADPSAPVADATQDFCAVNTPTVADLTATGTTIQWYDAATAGNLLVPTTALVDGTTYYATQTVGTCESSLRTAVVVTIAADPSAPVADATQDFCTASTPTVADLTATGTTIQWYDAATAGNLLAPTTALISGNTYYASQTIGTCESSLRTAVVVTIAADPSAPVADATQDFCTASTPTVADLTATGTTIQWYDAATAGNLLAPTTALISGNTYYASQTIGTCESSLRTAVVVTIAADPSAPVADATQDFCASSTPTVADLTATGTTIQWYDAATAGNLLAPTTALVDGNIYYATQTIGTCESSLRTAVTVTLVTLGAPTTGDTTQEFCSTDAPTLADIQVNEPDIRWYASATGGTPLPTGTALTDGTTYYAAQYNAALNCESALRLAILVILRTDVPGETIGWDADVCLQETVTYTTNSGMTDYDWIVTGGTIVGGGQLTDNFATIEWTTAGNGSVGVSFINAANCNPLVEIDFAVLVTACGDLAVTKAVNNTTPAVGDNIVFTINVTHLGNGAFTDIVINENLPAGYQYVSAQASVGNYNAISGLWTIPVLDANVTATLLITATVRGSGEYLNVAYLESSLPIDSNPDNNRGEATINPNGIFIYNGISPNGDGLNDYLKIDGLSRYPNNTVEIYNRYGVKVFGTTGYDTSGNVFRGISDGRTTVGDGLLPVGTYFYTIRYETPEGNTLTKSGYLYITE